MRRVAKKTKHSVNTDEFLAAIVKDKDNGIIAQEKGTPKQIVSVYSVGTF